MYRSDPPCTPLYPYIHLYPPCNDLTRHFLLFLQDPEPEKLEVPDQMLKEVYAAAQDVLRAKNDLRARGSVDEKDGPRARRRCVVGAPRGRRPARAKQERGWGCTHGRARPVVTPLTSDANTGTER